MKQEKQPYAEITFHIPVGGNTFTSFRITMPQDPTLAELETAYIDATMKRLANKTQAAKVLGIDRRTLYRKLKDMGAK